MDEAEIVKRLDSVESSVKYLQNDPEIDLVFMDVQLADGISFDIFSQVKVKAPVFTTAFDQYTLKAFKVNSIDYLLKPKWKKQNYNRQFINSGNCMKIRKTDFSEKMHRLIEQVQASRYKERLLIKRGQQLSYLKTSSAAFCFADGKLCYAVDFSNNKFLLENNLSQLEEQLDRENLPDQLAPVDKYRCRLKKYIHGLAEG